MEKVINGKFCIKISTSKEMTTLQHICDKSQLKMAAVMREEKFPLYFFCWDQNGGNYLFYDEVIPYGHSVLTIDEVKEKK